MSITKATLADVSALHTLVNSSYRGESSHKGWTTEAGLIDGQRIDHDSLVEQLNDPSAVILKNTDESGNITGCVYLQNRGDGSMYLGMLSVKPELQARGLGKQLLLAAEDYAFNWDITTIVMTVITTRTELLNYYERRGYSKTGEVIPLIIEERFGILKQPLNMYKLEKKLK
ncbi:GNAT family N-acetyltransferase [Mucilaginibacter terrenus]|uniref:GNAT family N-acetyltransferase n=1 Tax=Mucilaginibacter terrenus TaxID=2482727 RepID=A0A3E2NX40_9SPHI|nr:GNAT family N-acetyltransferase [Mucilaginibacter terrenus]RFZ85584.1 GNAT family N-acetyltransferase [Mucilaginibacter terrenus]